MANADSVSDTVYRPGHAPSLKAACVVNSLGDPVDPPDREKMAWCGCVAKRITDLAPDRVERYTSRYMQLGRDMWVAQTAVDRGQDHPDISLLGAYQRCAR
jgi:hypothetical protein